MSGEFANEPEASITVWHLVHRNFRTDDFTLNRTPLFVHVMTVSSSLMTFPKEFQLWSSISHEDELIQKKRVGSVPEWPVAAIPPLSLARPVHQLCRKPMRRALLAPVPS